MGEGPAEVSYRLESTSERREMVLIRIRGCLKEDGNKRVKGSLEM